MSMLKTLGIAAGQSAINQGVGMLNMELKAQQIVEEDRKNGEKQTAEKA